MPTPAEQDALDTYDNFVAVRDEIDAGTKTWSALADFFTEDAAYIDPAWGRIEGREAIRTFFVDSMAGRIRSELGGPASVIATGGLAGRIARESRVIERVEPFLTLEGLRILFEKNRPERSKRAD